MRILLTSLLGFILFLNTATANAAEAIGTITSLKGTIERVADKQDRDALEEGSEVFEMDKLQTGKASLAVITFNDETTLTLGQKAILEIDKYSYTVDDATNNSAEFSITKGPFKYVSGLIAKTEKPDVTLNVDFGSIGIRGTKVWRDLIGDDEGQIMCRIYVEDGEVDVSNEHGTVTLGHEDGTKIRGTAVAPTRPEKWKDVAIKDIKSKTE